ncbi:hypothetical protein CAEBREN_10438 [Caenorhabditis brenneri]|uniref:Uncharacterized protein n=1 Tax=Caenorhabditis brenneri TaxID=135651 RepID=G0P3P4_CAEBE|nr:hypothetical protein CAEBREN_10438 [Caenorhabditis brenneri]
MTRKKNTPKRVKGKEEKEGNGVEKGEAVAMTVADISDEVSPTKRRPPVQRRPMDLSSEPSTSVEPRAAAGPVTLASPRRPQVTMPVVRSPVPDENSFVHKGDPKESVNQDVEANWAEILGKTARKIAENRANGVGMPLSQQKIDRENDIIRKYAEATNDKTHLDIINCPIVKKRRRRGNENAVAKNPLKRSEPNDGHAVKRDSPVKKPNPGLEEVIRTLFDPAPEPVIAPPIGQPSRPIEPPRPPIGTQSRVWSIPPPREEISGRSSNESAPKPCQTFIKRPIGQPSRQIAPPRRVFEPRPPNPPPGSIVALPENQGATSSSRSRAVKYPIPEEYLDMPYLQYFQSVNIPGLLPFKDDDGPTVRQVLEDSKNRKVFLFKPRREEPPRIPMVIQRSNPVNQQMTPNRENRIPMEKNEWKYPIPPGVDLDMPYLQYLQSQSPEKLPNKKYDGPTIRQVLQHGISLNALPAKCRVAIAPMRSRYIGPRPSSDIVLNRLNRIQMPSENSTPRNREEKSRILLNRFGSDRQVNSPQPSFSPPVMNRLQMPSEIQAAKNREEHIPIDKEIKQEINEDLEVIEHGKPEEPVPVGQALEIPAIDWKRPRKSYEGFTLKQLLDAEFDEPGKSSEVVDERGTPTPPNPVNQVSEPIRMPLTLNEAKELAEKRRNEANTDSHQPSKAPEAVIERDTSKGLTLEQAKVLAEIAERNKENTEFHQPIRAQEAVDYDASTPPDSIKQVHKPASNSDLNALLTSRVTLKGITLKQAKEITEKWRDEKSKTSEAVAQAALKWKTAAWRTELPITIRDTNMPSTSTPPVPVKPAHKPASTPDSSNSSQTRYKGMTLQQALEASMDYDQPSSTSESVAERDTPTPPVPVKPAHKPASMPDSSNSSQTRYKGLTLQQALEASMDYDQPVEAPETVVERDKPMTPVPTLPSGSTISNPLRRGILLEINPNRQVQKPVKVIWKKRSIIVPDFMKCDYCQDRMELWCDKMTVKVLGPFYRCKGCPTGQSIARKFDEDERKATAAWPPGKMTGPALLVKNFDDVEEEIPKPPEKKRPELYCRDPQTHHLIDHNCSRLPLPPQDLPPWITATRYQKGAPQMTKDPLRPKEIVVLGDPSKYCLRRLVQKVMVVSGREESEEVPLKTELMNKVSAKEFMESLTTLLMPQNSSENKL